MLGLVYFGGDTGSRWLVAAIGQEDRDGLNGGKRSNYEVSVYYEGFETRRVRVGSLLLIHKGSLYINMGVYSEK